MSPPGKSFYLYHYMLQSIYIYITSAQIVFHSIEWTSHKSRMTEIFLQQYPQTPSTAFLYTDLFSKMSFWCGNFNNGSLFCTVKWNMKPNWKSHLKLANTELVHFTTIFEKEIISCPGWVAEYTWWWDIHQHPNYRELVYPDHRIFVIMYNLCLFSWNESKQYINLKILCSAWTRM